MAKNRYDVYINECDYEVIKKLAFLKGISVSCFLVENSIPKRIPKDLDAKVLKELKLRKEIKKIDREFKIFKTESQRILEHSFAVVNAKNRIFKMMLGRIDYKVIYNFVQHCLKLRKILPTRITKAERVEWELLKRLSRVRCGSLQKVLVQMSEGGFPDHVILSMANDYRFIFKVYNKLKDEGLITYERYLEKLGRGDFQDTVVYELSARGLIDISKTKKFIKIN